MTRWFVMGVGQFCHAVGCVGSHFVCGFRVCPVCWVCDHKCGRVLLSHRDVRGSSYDVHFVVSRRESHSFVSVCGLNGVCVSS